MDKKCILLIGNEANGSDLRYGSGFSAPDDFVFFQYGEERFCGVSALEFNRAEATVHPGVTVVRAGKKTVDTVMELCRRCQTTKIAVPPEFPFGTAEELRSCGMELEVISGPVFPEREFKNIAEVQEITRSLRAAEAGCRRAIEVLEASEIDKEKGILLLEGVPLTSEMLRAEIDCTMLRQGMLPTGTICAGGTQGAQPHNQGSGVLPANYPIVMDIFPKSAVSGYWGDLTRTVVKGTPSDFMLRAFDAVLEAREFAKSCVRIGAVPSEIHQCVVNILQKRGFETGFSEKEGDYGFFHGLGHGVGLDIHEAPRVNPGNKTPLQGGEVITDEPGLYYAAEGGIRLEDMIWLRPDGVAETLTEIETIFRIA